MGLFDRFRRQQQTAYSADAGFLETFQGQPIHYDIRRLSPAEMWETQPHLRTVVAEDHAMVVRFDSRADRSHVLRENFARARDNSRGVLRPTSGRADGQAGGAIVCTERARRLGHVRRPAMA